MGALASRVKHYVAHAAAKRLYRTRLLLLRRGLASQNLAKLFGDELAQVEPKPSLELVALSQTFNILLGKAHEKPLSLKNVRAGLQTFYGMSLFAPLNGDREHVEPVTADGVPCAWVSWPGTDAGAGVLLFVHGWAYLGGTLKAYRGPCGQLSQRARCRVLFVDYTLLPKASIPEMRAQLLTVYRWLLRDVPGSRIAIAGDSAGGGLSLGLLQDARDADLAQPACAVLLSPVADVSNGLPSVRDNVKDALFKSKTFFDASIEAIERTSKLPAAHARNSPLFGDFSGLAPLFVCAGLTERLVDNAREIIARAEAAGVAVESELQPHAMHNYPLLYSFHVPEYTRTLDHISAFVGERIKRT